MNILRWDVYGENIHGFYSYCCCLAVTVSGINAAPVATTNFSITQVMYLMHCDAWHWYTATAQQ